MTAIEFTMKVDDDELSLNYVSFLDNLNLRSDTEDSFGMSWQVGPHWVKDHPEATLPVAYSCGSANNLLTCGAVISGDADPDDGLFEIRFVYGNGSSEWFTYFGGGYYTESLSQTFAELFGQQQAYYDEKMTLTWEYRIDGDDQGEFAENENTLYVTYNNPLQSAIYHTVVHVGCTTGAGGAEAAAFEAIWGKFKSLNIHKVDFVDGKIEEGEVLTYYGSEVEAASNIEQSIIETTMKLQLSIPEDMNPCEYPTLARQFAGNATCNTLYTDGLLLKLDGTCGAWQDFMVEVLGAQGISSAKRQIRITPGLVFKVNSTAVGQGTSQPCESIWGDHGVVEYYGKIYDPSYALEYGIESTALAAFLDQSVESVGTVRPPLPSEVTQGYGKVYVIRAEPASVADFVLR